MQSDSIMRERQLNIRLSEEEAERVERVAQHHGINAAALFRMLLKREARELGLEPSTPTTRATSTPAELPAESTPTPTPKTLRKT